MHVIIHNIIIIGEDGWGSGRVVVGHDIFIVIVLLLLLLRNKMKLFPEETGGLTCLLYLFCELWSKLPRFMLLCTRLFQVIFHKFIIEDVRWHDSLAALRCLLQLIIK